MNKELEQKAKIARLFFEKIFIEYRLRSYRAYCNNENFEEYEFEASNSIEWSDLDSKLQHFEDLEYHSRYSDGISLEIYKIPILDFDTIAYRMETDGDDGWIVIFSNIGDILAVGYTYIEVIAWDLTKFPTTPSENIDSSVLSFQVNNMSNLTFWSKKLEDAENIAYQRLQNIIIE